MPRALYQPFAALSPVIEILDIYRPSSLSRFKQIEKKIFDLLKALGPVMTVTSTGSSDEVSTLWLKNVRKSFYILCRNSSS